LIMAGMRFPRFETWPTALGRRLMARYLSDLLMSICLALTGGWLLQAAAGNIDLRDAMITHNGTYVAISRFTPANLVASYFDTVEHMTQHAPVSYHLADGVGAVIEQTVAMVVGLLLAICVGVPGTLIGLYQAASGIAGWVVLAGFGMAIGAVFHWLRAAKVTSRRLLVGLALVPLAISAIFIILQALMVLVLATCFWFASLAPFVVAAVVLCPAYWLASPRRRSRAYDYVVARDPSGTRPRG
jgi:hypothetical protein